MYSVLKKRSKNLVKDQKLILEELTNFYEKLYFKTETNNCELANNFFQKLKKNYFFKNEWYGMQKTYNGIGIL